MPLLTSVSQPAVSPLRRRTFRLALLGLVALLPIAGSTPSASANMQSVTAEDAQDETRAEAIVQDIRTLVLPQQIARARKVIKDYPNTHLAKIARQLLDEHSLYAREAQITAQRDQAITRIVKNHWANRPAPSKPEFTPLRITNLSDDTVMYQMKGQVTMWSGPYRLRSGETHVFNQPIQYRRITSEGYVEHTLSLGVSYGFINPPTGGLPQLYKLNTPEEQPAP